jgi:hypothetical protein
MTSGNAWKAGRVVIDDGGIVQNPVWGLFGKRFKLQWCDIVSWTVKDAVLLQVSTGKERVVHRLLCFFHKNGMDVISRSVGDKQFPLIVDRVRRHLPNKENSPVAFDPFELLNGVHVQGYLNSQNSTRSNTSL